MSALETFDWLKNELWSKISEDTRSMLKARREYLLSIRNENERRRFIEETMAEIRAVIKKQKN